MIEEILFTKLQSITTLPLWYVNADERSTLPYGVVYFNIDNQKESQRDELFTSGRGIITIEMYHQFQHYNQLHTIARGIASSLRLYTFQSDDYAVTIIGSRSLLSINTSNPNISGYKVELDFTFFKVA